MKKLQIVGILILLILGVTVYSEVTDLDGMSEGGLFGALITGLFAKLPVIGTFAVLLYKVLIVWGSQWIGRKLLAKVGTKWGPNGPNIFWKILGFFFGKIIYIKNATANSKLDPILFRVAELRLQETIKKYIGKSVNTIEVKAVSTVVKDKMKNLINEQYPLILDEKK